MTLPSDYTGLAAVEWLDTNGLGGYAYGTVAGASTRGYHGWLVAAVRPPSERVAIVMSADEWLVLDPPLFLSTHQYPGIVAPQGYQLIERFEAAPIPTWIYRTPAHRIERKIFMVDGENTTVVRYRLLEGDAVTLGIRPFLVFRDHHSKRHESDGWRLAVTRVGETIQCVPSDGGPTLTVSVAGAAYREDPLWYRRFEYLRELERGLPSEEDAYAPFVVECTLTTGAGADVIFTTEASVLVSAAELERRELDRRTSLTSALPVGDPVARRLATAASAFRVARVGGERSAIAGYPWFTDWGRDTMISLPGLDLATGQVEDGARILTSFAVHLRDGLLPNCFPDHGVEPQYNTVDASLWFAVAVYRLLDAGGDPALIDGPLTSAIEAIVEGYARGTWFGIREEEDGLVSAGADGVALTWMDARVGDWVVTPRGGKAVEINALWYNARRILAALYARQGRMDVAKEVRARAEGTRRAFIRAFWDDETTMLVDVIRPDGSPDRSVRPNQLFAASLPYPLITRPKARSVVAHVARELLTPRGLRTLAPSDPAYKGQCAGDVAARDAAYHQGTVWPWLIGPFVDAMRYAYGVTTTRARIRELLSGLAEQLDDGCIGQLSEIFDGDAPHTARGCPAQAWSVAELLRVWRQLEPRRWCAHEGSCTHVIVAASSVV